MLTEIPAALGLAICTTGTPLSALRTWVAALFGATCASSWPPGAETSIAASASVETELAESRRREGLRVAVNARMVRILERE